MKPLFMVDIPYDIHIYLVRVYHKYTIHLHGSYRL